MNTLESNTGPETQLQSTEQEILDRIAKLQDKLKTFDNEKENTGDKDGSDTADKPREQ
jgi:hypothetical protein